MSGYYLVSAETRRRVFFFQAEDGIRDRDVTGVQTCALPISLLREQREGDAAAPPPDLRHLTGTLGRVQAERLLPQGLEELALRAPCLLRGPVGLDDDHEPCLRRHAPGERAAGKPQRRPVEVLDRRRHDARRE